MRIRIRIRTRKRTRTHQRTRTRNRARTHQRIRTRVRVHSGRSYNVRASTKGRLIMIGGILVFILLIALLFLQKNSAKKGSEPNVISVEEQRSENIDSEKSERESEDTESSLQSAEDLAGEVIDEGSADKIDQDFEYVEDGPCEEWPSVDASGYRCNTVSYADESLDGTITVGVEGAYVAGEKGGLVLQVAYTNASAHHAVGITFTCDTGTIGFASDGGMLQLTGMYGMTKVSRDIYPGDSVNDAPVVVLGRTWDYQIDQTYYDPTDFGICWYYDPMSDPPESATITFRMFDLTSGGILGIYEIDIVNDEGIMTLGSVRPTTISDETYSCAEQIQELLSSVSDQVPFDITMADNSPIFLEELTAPYYLDAKLLDGETFLAKYANLYGSLISVTVNSNSYKIGPVTFYFAVSQSASDFDMTDNEYTARLIGYDLPMTWSWDMFTDFNGLDSSSDSVRTYNPYS